MFRAPAKIEIQCSEAGACLLAVPAARPVMGVFLFSLFPWGT